MSRYTRRAMHDGLAGFWVEDEHGKIFISWKNDCYNAIAKLCDLEDKEEAGRLISMPCKPDEWVYEAHMLYPTRLTKYYSKTHIMESMEAGYCIGYNKEEAEAKLAERKGTRNE